jgi:co-chaperonin GroES (HSP10)
MKLIPKHKKVILKYLKNESEMKTSLIVINNNSNIIQCKVEEISDYKYHTLRKNDIVLIDKKDLTTIKFDNMQYFSLDERDILGVYE